MGQRLKPKECESRGHSQTLIFAAGLLLRGISHIIPLEMFRLLPFSLSNVTYRQNPGERRPWVKTQSASQPVMDRVGAGNKSQHFEVFIIIIFYANILAHCRDSVDFSEWWAEIVQISWYENQDQAYILPIKFIYWFGQKYVHIIRGWMKKKYTYACCVLGVLQVFCEDQNDMIIRQYQRQ